MARPAFDAMLAAIEGARRGEVLLEMYWFGSDKTGRSFARARPARRAKGLRVCVTFDAFGSFEADPAMFDQMRAAGVTYEFHPCGRFDRALASRASTAATTARC